MSCSPRRAAVPLAFLVVALLATSCTRWNVGGLVDTPPSSTDSGADWAVSSRGCGIDLQTELQCRVAAGATPELYGTGWTAVVDVTSTTCGIRNQQLYCWGDNRDGSVGIPGIPVGPGSQVNDPVLLDVASGWKQLANSCAISGSDSLWCWGPNWYGKRGNGPTAGPGDVTPSIVEPDHRWISVDASSNHVCAIRTDGTLWCWGRNHFGQLGLGFKSDPDDGIASPTQVGEFADWEQVTVAGSHSCAIRTGGALYCWGENTAGDLGTGDTVARWRPFLIGDSYRSADALAQCGVRHVGELWCWGKSSTNGSPPFTITGPTRNGDSNNWILVNDFIALHNEGA